MSLSEADVVIVGAGAAGIAAAKRLASAGLSFVVCEARSRVGGRAWTVRDRGPFPFDLGCGWLHSADINPWTRIAEAEGLNVDRSAPPWQRSALENSFSAAEQREYHAAIREFYEKLDEAVEAGGPDRSLAAFLVPGGKWNARFDSISTYINGVELGSVSLVEYGRYEDTETNWRVMEGYGAAMERYAAGLPLAFDCAVRTIDHAGSRVKLVTSRGDIAARGVIVTVSTALIAEETIRFVPALPEKVRAASNLPMGLADKLFLSLAPGNEFPKDSRLFGKIYPSGAATYHLNPFGRPLIEAYFGGKLARELEAGGEAAFGDFAVEDLVSLIGSDFRAKITPLAASAWERDPFARGSYSYARVGHADERAVLAAPVNGRLFFAGEATSRGSFSTAHGAYETGLRAAEEVLRAFS
jgi:monoamine oxidase